MAQNITLLGASYSDVPSVELPKTGGGTAQFDDTTIASNAASASDITSGKLAFVNGELVTGTASGGGGGGLEYETGTWTPASDISNYVITFANTHETAPFCYMVSDAEGDYSDALRTNYGVMYFNFHQVFGEPWVISTTVNRYGIVYYPYRATSATTMSSSNASLTTPYTSTASSGISDSRFWATETGIRAYSNSTSYYWRTGRTYKWMAVWAPTS